MTKEALKEISIGSSALTAVIYAIRIIRLCIHYFDPHSLNSAPLWVLVFVQLINMAFFMLLIWGAYLLCKRFFK